MAAADDLIAAVDAADAAKCVELLSDREEKHLRALHPELARSSSSIKRSGI